MDIARRRGRIHTPGLAQVFAVFSAHMQKHWEPDYRDDGAAIGPRLSERNLAAAQGISPLPDVRGVQHYESAAKVAVVVSTTGQRAELVGIEPRVVGVLLEEPADILTHPLGARQLLVLTQVPPARRASFWRAGLELGRAAGGRPGDE